MLLIRRLLTAVNGKWSQVIAALFEISGELFKVFHRLLKLLERIHFSRRQKRVDKLVELEAFDVIK